MLMNHRRPFLIPGMLFGAWLGLIYAFVSQAVNWAFLPGIPIEPPDGGMGAYLLRYVALGGLLGIASALPEHRWMGAAAGAAVAALLMVGYALFSTWGQEAFGGTVVITILFTLPLVALMLPVAFLIRLGLDAQQPDPTRPYLWARRYLILAVMSAIAVGAGALSLFSPEVRSAMRAQHQMIQSSFTASTVKELPGPLQEIPDYLTSAEGEYTMTWSDRPETFFGPQPAGNELAQFLIITRFANGYRVDCIYSPNRSAPNCTSTR